MLDKISSRTSLDNWRLESRQGAHHWHHTTAKGDSQPQTRAEKYHLGIYTEDPSFPTPSTFTDAARNGWSFYQSLQLEDGHWACGYGGPSFLLPGLVFAMYITETPIPKEWTIEMTRYLTNHVNDDGGWGLHLEGPSTVLATGLYYVMLRLLGVRKEEKLVERARNCLLKLGGAANIPQWGKIWLSCLNLYSWVGVNPIPPEFWLLPDWLPFHPSKWWVQCRVVFLPTSYLYSRKFSMPLNETLNEIRGEIYTQDFTCIDFSKHRNSVAAADIKTPHSLLLSVINLILLFWEAYLLPKFLITKAQQCAYEMIRREDENTEYNCLAPVNKAFQMVSVWCSEGSRSQCLERHRQQLSTYIWLGHDGMTSSGTNGVQVWDTAFSIQAAVEAGLAQSLDFRKSLERALIFLKDAQLEGNLQDPYRQPRDGGWPFSTKNNGYIVSDCAAESLKAVLMLQEQCGFDKVIPQDRLRSCISTLLLMQNEDGGWASYERTRGSRLLEYINPAEVFDKIMVEYSYTECTTAVLTSLSMFRRIEPNYKAREIANAISRAIGFIKASQKPDGSWYGAWAICFTYATFFALISLESVQETWQNSPNVKKACSFLLSKQREDGGWGEHYRSCELQEYIQHEESQVVNTAWATLALMHAQYPDKVPIERGLKLIMSRQQKNGEWLQEGIEGVFNRTCMIGYPNYKHYFTVWALGSYSNMYLPKWKVLSA